MDNYTNLSTVTLYNTPLFSQTDSVLFESETRRDLYFSNIPNADKLELTDFTDLYEGRSIVLPYNYLDLKKYNTMKLYYNDGLGHTATYYCNVDNYIYVSTSACVPIYRIDYFLTYGHLLYNKRIDMFTRRRTVKEDEINTMMKADSIVVPKLHYDKKESWFNPNNAFPETEYYVIFLNNCNNNSAKKGIKVNFYLPLGKDSSNIYVKKKIDDYTIGSYIALCKPEYFEEFLNAEPSEYIEQIIQCSVPESCYKLSLLDQHYIYVTGDIDLDDFQYFKIANKNEKIIKTNILQNYGEFPDNDVNLYPNHDKKVMEWLPTKGFVVQGQEFDFKDFDDELFPTDSRVVETFKKNESTLYFYNCFGYTFCFPIGYRGESINKEFMMKWQSAKNFSYVNNYQNSLAYKQLMDQNSQAVINAERTAGVQSYYANLMSENANLQLDVTKSMTTLNYLSQKNNLSDNYLQTNQAINQQITEANAQNSWIFNLLGKIGGLFTGKTYQQGAIHNSQQIYRQAQLNNNTNVFNSQSAILQAQRDLQYQSIDIQKQANLLNTQYQCDTASATRDNSIAMISISNKYNNCKPGAYFQTDYSQYTPYYYIISIETFNETDFRMVDNIRNHYNVLGIDVGCIETWYPSVRKGLYFNYICGSILDNSNNLISNLTSEIFVALAQRIEQGIRLWFEDQLYWFGNLTIDNTYTGLPEPHYYLSDDDKESIINYINTNMYSYEKTDLIAQFNNHYFSTNERQYGLWIINGLPYGDNTISADNQTALNSFFAHEKNDLLPTSDEAINYVKKTMNNLTVYEKQYCLDTAIPLVYA